MKLVRNLVVVLTALVLAGLAKFPFDQRVAADLRARNLLPAPIELDTREELGQVSLAIALGGLRTPIASMMNLGTLTDWEKQDWVALENKYKTITTLQPNTRYYWTAAAHHLISNAWADYQDKPEVPEGRRKRIQHGFYKRGRGFLEKSVEKNPGDWRLWYSLGDANNQYWRPKDHDAAAEAFKTAFKLSGNLQAQRRHVYALCRIRGREAEAWEFTKAMWEFPTNHRVLSSRSIYAAMQNWANPPANERLSLSDLYGSRREALIALPDYWFRQLEGYPVHGLRDTIQELLEEFHVPEELSPLRYGPDRQFKVHPVLGISYVNQMTGEPAPRNWRSLWMDTVRTPVRAYLTYPDRATLSLSDFWLMHEEGYALPGTRALIEKLWKSYDLPQEWSPLLHEPDVLVSEHPLTNEPFAIDPETGEPTKVKWRRVWEKTSREALLEWLKGSNP